MPNLEACHNCGWNVKNIRHLETEENRGLAFRLFVAHDKTPREVRYDEDAKNIKGFCQYCIPLFEKNYRKEKCFIKRITIRLGTNLQTGKLDWVPDLLDNPEMKWDKDKKGWYDYFDEGNKYNFYEVFRGNNCQTCNNSLDQPSDRSCCQQSQENISKRERERERAKMEKVEVMVYW